MPRIPRRPEDGEESRPEDQPTIASGDPLASPTPASESGAPSGDPPTQVIPPAREGRSDASGAPPVPPASTAAPGEDGAAAVEPGGAEEADVSASAQSSGDQPTEAAAPVEQPTTDRAAPGDPIAAAQPTAETGDVSAQEDEQAPVDARPRFRQRTRMRRRLRYLRRLRELAFRDLGGLVFDLHRFGRERNDLVIAKLEALASIDRELRLLQEGLHERREFTDLREAGLAACPRCGTLHDTDANFCPGCGTTLRSAIVRDAFPVTVSPEEGQTARPQDAQQPTPSS